MISSIDFQKPQDFAEKVQGLFPAQEFNPLSLAEFLQVDVYKIQDETFPLYLSFRGDRPKIIISAHVASSFNITMSIGFLIWTYANDPNARKKEYIIDWSDEAREFAKIFTKSIYKNSKVPRLPEKKLLTSD